MKDWRLVETSTGTGRVPKWRVEGNAYDTGIPFSVMLSNKGVAMLMHAAPDLLIAAMNAADKMRVMGARFPEANCAHNFMQLKAAIEKAGGAL